MTEAAKSAEEIEDVLASIRRLVAGPAGKQSPAIAPVTAQKLVLTAALRVAEPEPGPGPAGRAEDAPGGDGDDTAWRLEDRLADFGEIAESAEEAVADAIAEGADDDGAWAIGDAGAFRASLTHLQSATASTEFEAEAGDTDWPDPGVDQALRELAQAREQAHEGDVATPGPAPLEDAPQDQADQDDAAADDVAETPDAAHDDAAEDAAEDAATPEPISQGVAPQQADVEDPEWPDDALLADDDGAGLIEDLGEDLGEDTTPFTFPEAEDGILDEETLREIIAEVVRQELQSELGQRITRGVRKMVRREVRLALALDELK